MAGSQVSTPLQALPSSQSAAVWHGTQPGIHWCEQPFRPPQVSTVQTLPSSQRLLPPSSICPLQLLSLPSHSSGPFGGLTASVTGGSLSCSSAFVAYAAAVLRKSVSLQPGAASAENWTVTCLPAPSVGDVTWSGFVDTTVSTAPGSSGEVADAVTLLKNAGSGTSWITTPTAWPIAFCTSIV